MVFVVGRSLLDWWDGDDDGGRAIHGYPIVITAQENPKAERITAVRRMHV